MRTRGRFAWPGWAFIALMLTACEAGAATNAVPTVSLAAAESHFAKLATNRVHYLTVGKGKHALVFVHAWACNATFWREQVPALSDKARLILIDLPGHGQSDKPKVDYTMDYFSAGVIAVLQDARVDHATLIGHSMGVPIICRAYAQAPEKIGGLVAVDGLLRRPALK